MNITFEHNQFLASGIILFILILLFTVIKFIIINRKKAIIADSKFLNKLLISYSVNRLRVKYFIRFIVLLLLFISAANPREFSKQQKKDFFSCEIVFCLDISLSMLADDISPSRLEFSKQLILKTITDLDQDKVGLVAYAGTAAVLQPLTTDYTMLKGIIRSIQPDFISTQGTHIEEAIEKAIHLFETSTLSDKVIILITDGEEHDGNLKNIANKIKDFNIKVIAIGVGSTSGSPIPISSNNEKSFKRDKSGNVVITKLDEDRLNEFAKKTNGVYSRASGLQRTSDFIKNELDNLIRQEEMKMLPSGYINLYYIPLLIACFLLFIDIVVLDYLYFVLK